jgi:hypothetical protein
VLRPVGDSASRRARAGKLLLSALVLPAERIAASGRATDPAIRASQGASQFRRDTSRGAKAGLAPPAVDGRAAARSASCWGSGRRESVFATSSSAGAETSGGGIAAVRAGGSGEYDPGFSHFFVRRVANGVWSLALPLWSGADSALMASRRLLPLGAW